VREKLDLKNIFDKFEGDKTLIVFAGLPGVGKTYACKYIVSKLKDVYFFDADQFSLSYEPLKRLRTGELSGEENAKILDEYLKAKALRLKELFVENDIIVMDGLFSRKGTRKLFYDVIDRINANLVFVHIVCDDEILKKRIYDDDHILGSGDPRWKIFLESKARFENIDREHVVFDSSEGLDSQIDELVDMFAL
jgi:predicted kinase